MGNDGHIQIWRRDEIFERWHGAGDRMAKELKLYNYELPEIGEVYVGYYGDLPIDYDWNPYDPFPPDEEATELEEFCWWLMENSIADWEIWT